MILGASGDLAERKLVPALEKLYRRGELSDCDIVVGSGRTPFTDEQFRARFSVGGDFARLLHYHRYIPGLKKYIESNGDFSRVVFFMALPPFAYAATAAQLSEDGFGDESSLIVEKPFGYNYVSSRELDTSLAKYFDESNIYRIDHYLAKEAVQNILVFRFANSLFYPVWNSRYVESIQISAFEDQGVEHRAAYFDRSGIIRDMVQNHLTQLLCLLTMEAPVSLDAEDIRAKKIDILRCMAVDECHRFQYEGYQQEQGIAPGSTTETYAELKLHIDNFRWTGMPVYIRTGKALNRKGTEIGMTFRPLPRLLFNDQGRIQANRIIFKIQPAEGIVMDISSKTPGSDAGIAGTHMDFCYRSSFTDEIPKAYQRLLLDVFREDRTLFVGAEETETSWKLFDGVLDKGEPAPYPKGRVPQSRVDAKWIDFDQYAHICA